MGTHAETNFEGVRYRAARFDKNAINVKARTVQLSFSSELPIEDGQYGVEKLSHDPGAPDFSRLNNGAPLLLNHNRDQQIGVVESAYVDPKMRHGVAVVRLSDSQLGEEVFRDIQNGIRTKASMSFSVKDGIRQPDGSLLVTRWMPGEISIVPLAADESIGVGMRSQGELRRASFSTICSAAIIEDVTKADRLRISAINSARAKLSPKYPGVNIAKMADEAIERGASIEDFQKAVFENITDAKPLDTATTNVLSDARDFEKYSVSRAILSALEKGGISGFEKDVSQEIAKRTRQSPQGFFVPQEVLYGRVRALGTSTAPGGGFLVGTELRTGEFVDLLRNRPVVEKMGARTLSGLVGNIAIPKLTGASTAYWLPETGSVTESDQTFGQLALTPHRLVGDTAFSKELLAQNQISTEAIVRDDLTRVANLAIDLAALAGSGNAGQPLGIANTAGLSTAVTFGGAPTWPSVVQFETNIAASNADMGSLGFVTSPAVRGIWKTTTKAVNYPIYLWENDVKGEGDTGAPSGLVNGYRAMATNQVASATNLVYFGNWNDLVIARWAGIDFVLDPYSLKKSGQIEVTMTQWCDIGIRHNKSFCISADSGAQ